MKKLSELLNEFQSVILGTDGNNTYPFSSYAPFYYDNERIYIFISNIATHAKNIQVSPKASALFIEDESKTQNIFARCRISLQCDVLKIARGESDFSEIMQEFKNKFEGNTLSILMGMNDFNLYALTPIYGEATFGFGEAYSIGGKKMNTLIPRQSTGGHK